MSFLDYHLFVNLLRFCDRSCLFPLLLTSKEIKDLTWRHLIDFLGINLKEIFNESCIDRNLETIKFLLQDTRFDPSVDNNDCITFASHIGNEEAVRLLLNDPRVDPSIRNNEPIRLACRLGCSWMYEIYTIDESIKKCYLEIIKLLLKDPRVDPSDKNNECIYISSKFEIMEIMKLFLQDHRIDEETKEFYRTSII